MMHPDLHTHSSYSCDGEFSIASLVSECVTQKVELWALTDHNTVRGIPEAIVQARQAQIEFIPGVEIDCCYDGTDMHLLGYNIRWESHDFAELEANYETKVIESFSEMIHNLRRLGFSIDEAPVLNAAKGKLPTAELIAEVMLSDEQYDTPLLAPYQSGGERSDMPYINFYLDYFAQGKSAYVPIEYMGFKEAMELVRDNGGTPIVAHPGLNWKGREQVATTLLDHGADGLELFNNYHTPEQIDYFATAIRRKKAIMTCGSDFHGKTKPLIRIGKYRSEAQFISYLTQSIAQLL